MTMHIPVINFCAAVHDASPPNHLIPGAGVMLPPTVGAWSAERARIEEAGPAALGAEANRLVDH